MATPFFYHNLSNPVFQTSSVSSSLPSCPLRALPPVGGVGESSSLGRQPPLVVYTNNAAVLFDDSFSQSSICSAFSLQKTAARLLPDHRVKSCLRRFLPSKSEVEIWYSSLLAADGFGRAKYANLIRCGSIYACPICASKVAEVRRSEVDGLIQYADAVGLIAALVTLTVPHTREMAAIESRSLLVDSWRSMSEQWAFKNLGLFGYVKVSEVTHTRSAGFHPHFHAVFLFEKLPSSKVFNLRRSIYDLWAVAVARCGGGKVSYQHGVSVRLLGATGQATLEQSRESISSYLFKQMGSWGAAEELTKGHLKKGADKFGSRTPIALLADAQAGDAHAGALWVEYVQAFSGYRQITWSRGLKKHLSLEEVSDSEIVEGHYDGLDYALLATITEQEWHQVQALGARGWVLELARQSFGDPVLFRSALDRLLSS